MHLILDLTLANKFEGMRLENNTEGSVNCQRQFENYWSAMNMLADWQ